MEWVDTTPACLMGRMASTWSSRFLVPVAPVAPFDAGVAVGASGEWAADGPPAPTASTPVCSDRAHVKQYDG